MSLNGLLFSQKSSTLAVWHNRKYAAIFLTIFTAVILDFLKQTYQIFRTAIFQGVSEDLTLSYDLIFTALYRDLTVITGFVGNSEIS